MSTRSQYKRVNKERRRPQSREIVNGKVKNTDIKVNEVTHKRKDIRTKTTTFVTYIPKDITDPLNFNRLVWTWNMDKEIFTEDQILERAFGKRYRESYELVKQNKQEFYDDLFLIHCGCIQVTYAAKKWGFERYTGGRPAKSELNKVIKNIYLLSGGRPDHIMTRHHLEKGAYKLERTLNITTKSTCSDIIYQAYVWQKYLISQIPISDPRRSIFEPSEMCVRIVLDIDGLKSKHETVSKAGKKTYKWSAFVDDIYDMINYEAYKDIPTRICEIATNYPKTMVNQ